MLRLREPRRQVSGPRLDGVSAITILLLGLCAAGLLVAGFLAMYDYSTPAAEAPLLLILAVIFGAVLALNVMAATVRHLSRR